MGWPPTKRSPSRSACATRTALVLATSVTTASGRSDPRHGPASPSSDPRQAVGGPARTTRSASAMAACGNSAQVLNVPSATPRRGPSPVGDQAVMVQLACPVSVRMARAIDPPINPNPRKPMCMRRVSQPGARRVACRPAQRQDGVAPPPPRRRFVLLAAMRRSVSSGGGPGSSAGLCRRTFFLRSPSRRSSFSAAPQRGQRRSSAKSDSRGDTV